MGLADVPPAQLLSIPSGDAGVTATLKLMANIARQYKVSPLLRQAATRIVSGAPAKDDMAEVAAVQNWVANNIRYTQDVLDVETLQTPDYTLQEGTGDCDDQSILVATLLMAIGIPAAYCAVGVDGGPFSHVMAVAILRQHTQIVQVPCETTVIDPTTRQPVPPGWFPPDVTCMRFWHI